MGENEKLNKFEQLAEKRVSEVLKKMQLIGNLANRNNYDYTEKHVKQIIETLESELKMLKSKFGEKSLERKTTFKFKQ
ncbi:hypothetical protein OB974_24735 [Bacillus cereus]|uniref:Uncharacterized protein n=2 Tax=Bacillus cereus group TaxID=86661 RepID=A0A9X6T096_BACCE|nr:MULTISPECIES: hypothetical protein [Bacillus cereus group]PEU77058.1 hypothetical protein CN394_23480 [Bacillus anthracis]ABY42080.1 conserved hypothetical protein [Bacillus mycoides KBAB4]MCH5458247.1 hypothetical protein [Bacillus cereus]MCU5310519.1 hypothetical protein [Bacillus cereus]PDZ98370.1 hypothetical protein CON36_12615 [Bacillus cereus]